MRKVRGGRLKGHRGCNRNLTVFQTPLGWAGIAATERGICRIILPRRTRFEALKVIEATVAGLPLVRLADVRPKAVRPLQKYFSGKRVSFDLPLDMSYYTIFQKAVWKAAAAIPFGETRSYAWVAKKIRNPRAPRAVGRALGSNPVPIIIP